MRNSTKKYLEDELFSYPKMNQYINTLREEIINPWKPQDENIGGGKSNVNVSTVEIKATRLVNDKRLNRMREVKQAVETVYREASIEEKDLLEIYYFKHPRTLTIDGVAQELSVSRRTVFRLRSKILTRFADELGIIK